MPQDPEQLFRELQIREIELEMRNEELHQAEETLRDLVLFLRSTLDAILSHVAIVDDRGQILAVNLAWRIFALANGVDPNRVCEGANYLRACDQAAGEDSDVARAVAAGIRAVLRGEQDSYSSEYPCDSPDEKRWFMVRVTRFSGAVPPRVVVSHDTITERKRARMRCGKANGNSAGSLTMFKTPMSAPTRPAAL